MPYRLTSTSPDGDSKTWEPSRFLSGSVTLASLMLIADAEVSGAEADRFAYEELEDAPLSSTVTHAMTGWAFRIDYS